MKMMALSQMMTFKRIYWPHSLRWRHNEYHGVSNHRRLDCLLNSWFRRKSKKTPKLRITGLCEGNPLWPVDSPHKGPVTRKMFPFVDVIIFPADHGGVTIAVFVDSYPLLTFAWSLESQSCFTCVSAAGVRLHLLNMNVIISKCFDNSENEENNCVNAEIISPMTKLTITSTAFSGFIWRLVANQQGSYDNCARCYMFWT